MKCPYWNGPWLRELFVLLVLTAVSTAGTSLGGQVKFDPDRQLGFEQMIPTELEQWERLVVGSPGAPPDGLMINELFQALYTHPDYGRLAITLEYTSDTRRQFELHYPDICHSIRGDQVITYPAEDLRLADGRFVRYSMMDWQQHPGASSALTVYWYVTPDGTTINTFQLKMDQFLSGLLRRPGEALMVRLDAFYDRPLDMANRSKLKAGILQMINHLHANLDPLSQDLLFNELKGEKV